MFDERFARQYRYEPPPEFPLASPYAGIVHHLSGPSGRALTQTFHQRIMVGRCCCLRLAPITFITHDGFSTGILACTLDSLVRVSRRAGKDFFHKIAHSPSSQPPTSIHQVNLALLLPANRSILCTLSGTALANLHLSPTDTILLYRFLLNGFRSFDILSKLLFIFPSQYLFAIGFPHIFSLRRSLSPA